MILVTGGTGLVGSQLLFDLSKSGEKIRALHRSNSDMSVVNRLFSSHPENLKFIEWCEGDVTDVFSIDDAMNGIEKVFHSAAIISFNRSEADQMLKVNIEGTANMVNMALKNNVRQFCYVSSVAALGRTGEESSIDENSWWKTSKMNSNYAISKYGGEREVWRGIEEGLKAFIINPTIIIGPGNWQSGSTQMFSQVWKGLPFYATGCTGFVDVRDVSKAAILLMEKNITNERYIVNSENVSYRYVFDLIAENLNKKKATIKVTPFLTELGWRLSTMKSWFLSGMPMITKETARNGLMKWDYSNQKIKDELGFEFIPIRKSVEDTTRIYLKEMKRVD
jgi:nucleoside-diphosphate-sugar epimerase